MTENVLMLPTNRINWIFRILLIGLATQMLLSFRLWWMPDDILPYLPVIETSGQWLEQISIVLFPVFLLLILACLRWPDKEIILKLLFISGLFLVLGNIHRLQVWFYYYGLLLILFLWRKKALTESFLITMRGVVIGVYLWSGLHKFNVYFVNDIFPWLVEPLGITATTWQAYGAGGVEMLIGIGLLFQPTRNFTVVGSLIFHLTILGLLGPFGHNWNMVVWPWNLVMPILVFLLFYKTKSPDVKNILSILKKYPIGLFVLGLVWILPAFNYIGFTPEQLSFKMYAGSHPEMVLYFGESDRNILNSNPVLRSLLPHETEPQYRVVLDDVAMGQWRTPLFTTRWTGERIARQFCGKMVDPKKGGILYFVDDDFVEMPCEEVE